jgi:hypothetical protein
MRGDPVADWNHMPENREVAEAEVGSATAATYDPTLLAGGLVVLGSITTSVTANHRPQRHSAAAPVAYFVSAAYRLRMGWVLRPVETGIEGRPCSVDVLEIDHPGDLGGLADLIIPLAPRDGRKAPHPPAQDAAVFIGAAILPAGSEGWPGIILAVSQGAL